jgi:hypothetical protein
MSTIGVGVGMGVAVGATVGVALADTPGVTEGVASIGVEVCLHPNASNAAMTTATASTILLGYKVFLFMFLAFHTDLQGPFNIYVRSPSVSSVIMTQVILFFV